MARKNAMVSVDVTDSNIITITVEGQKKPLILEGDKLSPDIWRRAAVHGLVQKISDAAAIKFEANEPDDEKAAAKHAAMSAVIDRLVEGDWSKRGDASGETAPSGLIRRAAFEWMKSQRPDLTDERFEAWYSAKDRAGVLALRKVPEIASIIERIKSERGANASAKVDAASLLAELD